MFLNHICYTVLLDMFRASLCSSSGGKKILCTQYLVSSLCKLSYRAVIESARYGSLQSVTIPDTVYIQFSFLLKMSTTMLETCPGVSCNIYD